MDQTEKAVCSFSLCLDQHRFSLVAHISQVLEQTRKFHLKQETLNRLLKDENLLSLRHLKQYLLSIQLIKEQE